VAECSIGGAALSGPAVPRPGSPEFRTALELYRDEARSGVAAFDARLRRIEERLDRLEAGQGRLARWNQNLSHQAGQLRKALVREEGA
jgi:hypothetical protein